LADGFLFYINMDDEKIILYRKTLEKFT